MDTADRLIEPMDNYIKETQEAKYTTELPIVNHKHNDIIHDIFYEDEGRDGVKQSASSNKNVKLLSKKIPYKNKEHRWYGAKYVHVNCVISEKYIRLVISKITGVSHKKIDITGLVLNDTNKHFKKFHKKFSKSIDINSIDISEFDFFTEIRLSSKHGFQVFENYIENPNGVIYYGSNNISNSSHNPKPRKRKTKVRLPAPSMNDGGKETLERLSISNDKYDNMISFNEPDDYYHFVLECYILNPGSYGTKSEERIIKELNITKVPKELDRGDCIDFLGNYHEIKTSYTSLDGVWSLLHIRLYQDYDYLIAILIDINNDFTPNFIMIEKDNINKENFPSLRYLNGNKETNEGNTKVEYGLTINQKTLDKLLSYNILKDCTFETIKEYFISNGLSKPK